MRISIEIETNDLKLTDNLFEAEEGTYKPKVFNEGATAKYEGSIESLTEGFPEIILISVEILKDIAIAVFSAWLYDKLKGKNVKKLTIEKTEIIIDKGEIQRIITEKIQEEK